MKLYDGGIIIFLIIAAFGWMHYNNHHEGKFIDVKKVEKPVKK